MKRVGICTLHDANPNFGATLQAFSLQEVVKNLGYEVEFLRFKKEKTKDKKKTQLKSKMYKPNSKFSPNNTQEIKINKRIINSNDYLNICDEIYDKEKHSYDSIIIGSDELWNLKNDSFIHRKEYYGYDLNCQNILAYAPSCNGTTKQYFNEYFNNKITLNNIENLSARDVSTKKFIKDMKNIDVPIVLDPTLLINDMDRYAIDPKVNEKYILVYDYRVTPEKRAKIQELAKAKNMKIYSIGFYNAWADKNIDANIFEFLGYVKNASYITTATFHGTIFSIIFKKQFVSTVGNCLKIGDILERFELQNRDVTHIDRLEDIIDSPIDYERIEQIKIENRKKSIEYLQKALCGDVI